MFFIKELLNTLKFHKLLIDFFQARDKPAPSTSKQGQGKYVYKYSEDLNKGLVR